MFDVAIPLVLELFLSASYILPPSSSPASFVLVFLLKKKSPRKNLPEKRPSDKTPLDKNPHEQLKQNLYKGAFVRIFGTRPSRNWGGCEMCDVLSGGSRDV